MALVIADRVQETSTTAGTGTLTLAGAVAGYQSFAVVGNGNDTYYTIIDPITNDWEVGLGTYTASGTTLSRTTVLASSNANALVPFAANSKSVFVTYPAGKSVYEDAAGNVGIGTNTPTLPLTIGPSTLPTGVTPEGVIITSETALTQPVLSVRRSAASGNPVIGQFASGGTATAPTVVASGRGLGRNTWYGFDGTNYIEAAFISVAVDGTPGTNDMPGRMVFATTPDGTASPVARLQINNAGEVLVISNAALGYGTGSGGTVTQGTSRATAVTLNKPTGRITMFSAAGAAAWNTFTVNNTFMTASDTVVITYSGGSNTYLFIPGRAAAGSFVITFYSLVGTAVDAPVINFTIIKAASA